jgi:oligopeptide/dipeptide ABC transporter ATP-binding protein
MPAYNTPKKIVNEKEEFDHSLLIEIIDLKTYFFVKRGIVKAVDGVSFSLKKGEILGLVGESGSGKSATGLSILRLVPNPPGKIVSGRIIFKGEDLLLKNEEEMRKLRGSMITMIQQNPDTSLNPVFRIGTQVAESIKIHQRLKKIALHQKVIQMLRLVRIASPEKRMFDYPHQLSGGMRQRVAGAIALSCQAKLLIADEPTTSLDVTTQMEFLKLLLEIRKAAGTAIIFITHDFGIVSKICDRSAVMYAGNIVEIGPTLEVIRNPVHPYTQGLINSLPNPELRGKQLRCIEGQPHDPVNLPLACRFAPRCPKADRRCFKEIPGKIEVGHNNHYVTCFYAE